MLVTLAGDSLQALKTRRQLLGDTYYRNGEIYVLDPTNVLGGAAVYGTRVFPIITEGRVNIDSPDDLLYAEFLIQNGLLAP